MWEKRGPRGWGLGTWRVHLHLAWHPNCQSRPAIGGDISNPFPRDKPIRVALDAVDIPIDGDEAAKAFIKKGVLGKSSPTSRVGTISPHALSPDRAPLFSSHALVHRASLDIYLSIFAAVHRDLGRRGMK